MALIKSATSATWLIRLHTFCQDSPPLADLMHSLARVTLWYASPRLQLVGTLLIGLKHDDRTN